MSPSHAALPSEECLQSIRYASQETGVPENLLLAVAKVETGRMQNGVLLPWPWAMNVRGVGQWLDTKDALLEQALVQIARGETLFDLGCFQLNYHWHGASFSSLDEMISPKNNALYAANFLKSLYLEFEDWTEAVGAYHSRTETLASAYKAKFAKHYDPNEPSEYSQKATTRPKELKRKNFYPLLQAANASTRLGSLVPSDVE